MHFTFAVAAPVRSDGDGADRAGEAGIYAAVRYQIVERGIPAVDPDAVIRPDGESETVEPCIPVNRCKSFTR